MRSVLNLEKIGEKISSLSEDYHLQAIRICEYLNRHGKPCTEEVVVRGLRETDEEIDVRYLLTELLNRGILHDGLYHKAETIYSVSPKYLDKKETRKESHEKQREGQWQK